MDTVGAVSGRRPRVATVWLGGCSGCHMSLLDMDERLLDLAQQMDLVFSPIMDVKEYPENVDVVLVEGAIANEDHVHMIERVRRRTRTLVALGDCAVAGNATALRNPCGGAEAVLRAVYVDRDVTNPCLPSAPGVLPVLLDKVRPLRHYVAVDYYVPGCPPSADLIHHVLSELLAGRALDLRGRAPLG
jgi:NAD-reducing hydrogenase small subunit